MNKFLIATLISLTPYNTVIADAKSVVKSVKGFRVLG